MSSGAIRVGVVEDIAELREMLAGLLAASPGFECVGAWDTGEAALDGIPRVDPRVVLMDIQLPGLSGVECVRRLKTLLPRTEFMMHTVFEDHEQVFEALAAGATGYLIKKTRPEALLEAIRDLDAGGAPMSASIARRVVQAFAGNAATDKGVSVGALSVREQEVLGRLSAGRRYKEIAEELHLSVHTVRTHLHRIYEKLQVHTKSAAIQRFRER
jgi:DNA-binding NarL/FixJ family response regulator